MKKILLIALCFAFMGSMAQAANRVVPTDYTTIQAALDAAVDGDTITLTNSAVYPEFVKVDKPNLKIVATAGQKPQIQSPFVDGSTTPTLTFGVNSGGTKFGSLNGGRIRVTWPKNPNGTTHPAVPQGVVTFLNSTDTLVTMENCKIDESGTTNSWCTVGVSIGSLPIASKVKLAYVDIDTSRPVFKSAGTQANGIVMGITGMAGGSFTAVGNTPSGKGLELTMDHVSVKYWNYVGLMPTFANSKINMNYCDFGVLGDKGRGTSSHGWGPVNNNGRADCPFTGTWSNSIYRSGWANDCMKFSGNQTSVTLNRCVLLYTNGYDNTGQYGALNLNSGNGGNPLPGSLNLTLDHCDLVSLYTAGSATSKTRSSCIWKADLATFGSTTAAQAPAYKTTYTLTIRNSNLYSDQGPCVIFNKINPGDTFVSDYNNVYNTRGFTAKPNVGYTAGAHDVSADPSYYGALASDVRYYNNTLKLSDENGGPLGTNGDYTDASKSITYGPGGVLNRAHGGWTLY